MGNVKLILTAKRKIAGEERAPGYLLLEGDLTRGVEINDLNKAIQLSQVTAVQEQVAKKDKDKK